MRSLLFAAFGLFLFAIIGTQFLSAPVPQMVIIPAQNTVTQVYRPVYRYSLVKGGVYSPVELMDWTQQDPIVAREYGSWALSRTRVTHFDHDQYFYVSYRRANSIFWTRSKLKIPSGELLLTDGFSFARVRCANQLSDTPRFPMETVSPDLGEIESELRAPAVSPESPAVLPGAVRVPQAYATFPVISLPFFTGIPVYAAGGKPPAPSGGHPKAYASESFSFLALGLSIAAWILVRRIMRSGI
jgi:hypothetical protein